MATAPLVGIAGETQVVTVTNPIDEDHPASRLAMMGIQCDKAGVLDADKSSGAAHSGCG